MLHKKQSVIIIFLYAIGVLVFLLIAHTPFYLPCMFKSITGIPCPTCGLTRAFLYIYQLNIISAVKMNILAAPLIIAMLVHLSFAFIGLVKGSNIMLDRFHSFIAKSWVIVTMIVLLVISGVYNILNFIL